MPILTYEHANETFTLERGHGRPEEITLSQAKDLWNSGTLADWNLSLSRLASFDWSIQKLDEYYREEE